MVTSVRGAAAYDSGYVIIVGKVLGGWEGYDFYEDGIRANDDPGLPTRRFKSSLRGFRVLDFGHR